MKTRLLILSILGLLEFAPMASIVSAQPANDATLPVRIEVQPSKGVLAAKRSRMQLVVTGHYTNGETRDLTRVATFAALPSTILEVKNGVATPKADGDATLTITVGKHQATIPVEVRNQTRADPIRFEYETLPVLTRHGCNAGSCHGSPQGKGGFYLSMFAYEPHKDEENLVRGGFNRRINVLEPEASLLLKKPTMQLAHVGGTKLSKKDVGYQILRDWIQEGGRGDPKDRPLCIGIVLHPHPTRVLHFPHVEQQLSVLARFSDGTSRDVTHIASYDVSDKEIISIETNGLATGLKRGQASVMVRYLNFVEAVNFSVVEDVKDFTWKSPPEHNYVDRLVNAKLKLLQYRPAETCADSEFIRRLHLDLTGLLPAPERVRAFLADKTADRRARLIDELLESPDFARHWAQKTADLMRIQPRTMKDGRAEAFANWLAEAYRTNMPFDQFVSKILTAQGDTRENPPANYFLGIASNEDLTEATTQIFMGARINCAKCHNHPFESWTQQDYYRLTAVFSRVKRSDIVTLARTGEMKHPATGKILRPWGMDNETSEPADRRAVFATWLTKVGNPYLARVEVNRIWANLLGRGIVHPVDDFRSSNPPVNVELLDALAKDFETHRFDRKYIIRLICNSQTYQRSSATNPFNEGEDKLFSHARVRRLSAEQLQDAVGLVVGSLPATNVLDGEVKPLQQSLQQEYDRLAKDQARQETAWSATIGKLPRWAGPWHVIGPFGDENPGRNHATAFPPEKDLDLRKKYEDGQLVWKTRADWDDGRNFALPAGLGAFYLHRHIVVQSEGPALLVVEKKLLQKYWLNGSLVFDSQKGKQFESGKYYHIPITLQQGANDLLLKASKAPANQTFYFDLLGPEKETPIRLRIPPALVEILARPTDQRSLAEKETIIKLRQDADGRVRELRGRIRKLSSRSDYATQRPYPEQSEFLRAFGQPKRESACTCERSSEPTVDQALQMLNGTLVFNQLRDKAADRYAPLKEAFAEELYLAAFARMPTPNERAAIRRYLAGRDLTEAVQDTVWAVLNTREFLFQH